MSQAALEEIIEAVLYEGFILYPYRPSAKKNRHRFTFGLIHPQAYSLAEHGAERCAMQTECLITSAQPAELDVSVRFLHPMVREAGLLAAPLPMSNWSSHTDLPFQVVPEIRVDGKIYQSWQEAVERRVQVPPLVITGPAACSAVQFSFDSSRSIEPITTAGGEIQALLLRRQEALAGTVEVALKHLGDNLAKVTVRVLNQTPLAESQTREPEEVLLRTMASTHIVLRLRGADFVSLLEPLPEHRKAAEECINLGTWPVLVGDRQSGQRDTMLSSPIILYDFPQIAAESPGSFFDGTEIDEMLTLRIQTLTDDEKNEMRAASEQGRRLLERTESLSPAELLRLHGARRPVNGVAADPFGGTDRPVAVSIEGVTVRVGDRVRLKPKGRADIFDIALSGKLAVIEALEQDFEDRVHVAVVLDSDPGKDLGLLRQPGHRFFFGVDELEPLGQNQPAETGRQEGNHG